MALRFVLIHGFSFTCNFPFQLRTLPNPKAQRPSTQAEFCDRQIPHSHAGCSKNGVAERCHKRRHAWLAHASRRSIAIDDVHVRLIGRFSDSSYRIILKIRLVDYTLRRRNLAASHNTCPEHRGALELGASRLWIDHQASIQNRVHARDSHLTFVIDFDFNHRGHVSQEATVCGNPDTSALTVLALCPSRLFGHNLRYAPQTTSL